MKTIEASVPACEPFRTKGDSCEGHDGMVGHACLCRVPCMQGDGVACVPRPLLHVRATHCSSQRKQEVRDATAVLLTSTAPDHPHAHRGTFAPPPPTTTCILYSLVTVDPTLIDLGRLYGITARGVS